MEQQGEFNRGYSLSGFGALSQRIGSLRKTDIRAGDLVILRTRNSVYAMHARGDDEFEVSGGWFERKGVSGTVTAVRGCSFGGCMLKIDIVAACGLCTEFANRLVTTPVRSFVVLRSGWNN
jgi:hypothetical protein